MLIALVHGVHYATWSLPLFEDVPNVDAVRIESAVSDSRFDSEGPQREGHARVEILPTMSAASTGVAYFQVVRPGDEPSQVTYEAIFANMKAGYIGNHLANGAAVEEVPANALPVPPGDSLTQLRRMAAQIGNDFVSIHIGELSL